MNTFEKEKNVLKKEFFDLKRAAMYHLINLSSLMFEDKKDRVQINAEIETIQHCLRQIKKVIEHVETLRAEGDWVGK